LGKATGTLDIRGVAVGVRVKGGVALAVGVAVKAVTVTKFVLDCVVPLVFVREAWLDKDPLAVFATVTCNSKVVFEGTTVPRFQVTWLPFTVPVGPKRNPSTLTEEGRVKVRTVLFEGPLVTSTCRL
jgi:hypothetical protein